MKKKSGFPALITWVIIAVIYAGVFAAEQFLPATSMLFTVLKKGATYALVAVSMNLLNGFTGIFSLGQAGFMLIGAYVYGIFTIPVADRPVVYQYYEGGAIQRATTWRSRRWASRRLSGSSCSGAPWDRSPTVPTCSGSSRISTISICGTRRET